MIFQSVLTCPQCGHVKRETMPADACQFFYECEACRQVLRPQPGDCCVFCSYGDTPCPPVQRAGKACVEGQLARQGVTVAPDEPSLAHCAPATPRPSRR